MSATGSYVSVAAGIFGAFPFASMIPAFQSPGLRKHPGVGLDDLLQTSANVSRRYSAPWSTQPAFTSSALWGGVVDDSMSLPSPADCKSCRLQVCRFRKKPRRIIDRASDAAMSGRLGYLWLRLRMARCPRCFAPAPAVVPAVALAPGAADPLRAAVRQDPTPPESAPVPAALRREPPACP